MLRQSGEHLHRLTMGGPGTTAHREEHARSFCTQRLNTCHSELQIVFHTIANVCKGI